MHKSWLLGVGALALLVGCGDQAHGPDELGYVLLDLEAQEAGFHLEGVTSSMLPVSVADDEVMALEGPKGQRLLRPEAGELWYVRGSDGAISRFQLGDDVTPDAVYVIGDEAAAEVLAERADDAQLLRAEDGWYQLAGREALLLLADGVAPGGLQEIVPVEPLGTADARDEPARGSQLIATPAMKKLALAGTLGAPSLKFGDARQLNGASMLRRRVACTDPVEGLWVTRHHDSDIDDWHFFTLEVRRDSEDSQRLTGRIRTRFWSGAGDVTWPVSCDEMPSARYGKRFDVAVEMPAEGTFSGGAFEFGGLSWVEQATRCNPRDQHGNERWYDYHVDTFSGVLTSDGTTIEAVVNDGARTHNQPLKLQRISCL